MADLTPPVVFVTMGTDHHAFGRLSSWIERWLASPSLPVVCRVQEGSSPAPAGAEALGILPREEYLAELSSAAVVVCQGGPGSIMEARGLGFVPIAVPRLASHREVVDDHQVPFTRKMADLGWARCVESEDELRYELDRAVANPLSLRRPPPDPTAEQTAAELDKLLADIPSRRLHLGRLPRAVRLAAQALRGVRA